MLRPRARGRAAATSTGKHVAFLVSNRDASSRATVGPLTLSLFPTTNLTATTIQALPHSTSLTLPSPKIDTNRAKQGQTPSERLSSATPVPAISFLPAQARSVRNLPAAAPTLAELGPLQGPLRFAPAPQVGMTAAATGLHDWVEAEGHPVDEDPYPRRPDPYAGT